VAARASKDQHSKQFSFAKAMKENISVSNASLSFFFSNNRFFLQFCGKTALKNGGISHLDKFQLRNLNRRNDEYDGG